MSWARKKFAEKIHTCLLHTQEFLSVFYLSNFIDIDFNQSNSSLIKWLKVKPNPLSVDQAKLSLPNLNIYINCLHVLKDSPSFKFLSKCTWIKLQQYAKVANIDVFDGNILCKLHHESHCWIIFFLVHLSTVWMHVTGLQILQQHDNTSL